MDELDYNIRPGTSRYGSDYEMKVIALFAIKCCNSNFDDFWIISNADGLKAFDDIVVYTKSTDGKTSLTFLQVKHKEDTNKNRFTINVEKRKSIKIAKGRTYFENIGIRKYEESFIGVKDLLTEQESKFAATQALLLSTNVTFKDMKFLFFTNTHVIGTHLQLLGAQQYDDVGFFKTDGGGKTVFKLSPNHLDNSDFTEQFFILCNQLGCVNGDIDAAIKDELLKIVHAEFPNVVQLFQNFSCFLQDWFNKPRKITKELLLAQLADMILSFFCSGPNTHMLEPNLEEKLHVWNEMLKFQVILQSKCDIFICNNNSSHKYIKSNSKFLPCLLGAVKLSKNAKIVYATDDEDVENCKRLFESANVSVFSQLTDLPSPSRGFVKELTYSLQGRCVPFGQLMAIDPSLPKLITCSDIVNLLANQLTIGDSQCLNLPKFHIVRTFPRVLLRTTVFNIPKCWFVVIDPYSHFPAFASQRKGVTKNKVTIVEDINWVERIISTYRNENIHVLQIHYAENMYFLEWIHSNTNNIIDLSNSLISGGFRQLPPIENTVEFLSRKFKNKVLIVANPGMGKTVFLEYLLNSYLYNTWIVDVSLNDVDYVEIFNVRTLLNAYEKQLSAKDKLIFKTMHRNRAVLFLLDGYDEIAPMYTIEASKIIMDLIRRGLRIIVTSREVTRNELESLMNVVAHTLQPFDETDQTNFLKKYYHHLCSDEMVMARSEDVATFVGELLQRTRFSNWDHEFTGVPLQCEMLAEVFAETCISFCTNKVLSLPLNLNLLDLYETFVEKKFNIHWHEKGQVNTKNIVNKQFLQKQKEYFMCNHKLAAMEVIFTKASIAQKPSKQFLDDVASGVEKSGLILGLNSRKRAVFIHRTFAEYFSALWIKEQYRKADDASTWNVIFNIFNSLKMKNLVKDLMKKKYFVVREIFDRLFCNTWELHTNVLNNDLVGARNQLMERTTAFKDAVGRTPLHLLAARGAKHSYKKIKDLNFEIRRVESETFKDILEMVLQSLPWKNKKDALMEWTPLEYAEERNAIGIIDLFFKYKFIQDTKLFGRWKTSAVLHMCAQYDYPHYADYFMKAKGLNFIHLRTMTFDNYFSGNTLLHESARYGSVNMVSSILPFFHVDAFNLDNDTPLYFACEEGHLDVVKLLVEEGADIFSEDMFRNTPLDVASWEQKTDVIEYLTSVEVMKFLYGNDVNTPIVKNNRSALHLASSYGNAKTIEQLLLEGATIDIVDAYNETPLHVAAKKGHLHVIELLVKNGSDIFARGMHDRIPLEKAIQENHADVVKYLTAFDLLQKAFGDDVNKALVKNSQTALHLAARGGNVDTVKKLLAIGADINLTTKLWKIRNGWNSWATIHYAAKDQRTEVIRVLVELGADVNNKVLMKIGGTWMTALTYARLKDYAEMFMCLYDVTVDKEQDDILYYQRLNADKLQNDTEE